MYMIIAMVLLGFLSVGTAYHWRRKLRGFENLFSHLGGRFNPEDVDISGQQKYTRCVSHKWVMKNLIHGDYTQSEGTLGDFVAEKTVGGTIVVGLLLGSVPVIGVYLLFQSFVLVGAALVAVFAAVFIIRSPGDVGVSYHLLSYLSEEDQSVLGKGDLAYAIISSNRIKVWIRNLVIIAAVSFVISPWGELLPDVAALIITGFFQIFMTYIYLPIAAFSPTAALIVFVFGVPLVPILLYAVVSRMRRKARIKRDGFIVED
jgi:hypothetical protein